MKDVFNEYLKSTEEMRAILALRSPEEAAYDKEVGGGLKKGWSITKALKRAALKHPDEALQWDDDSIPGIREKYEWLMEHEDIMAKAKAMGFKEDRGRIEALQRLGDVTDTDPSQAGGAHGASFNAVNRILEKEMERDPRLSEELAAKGKGVLAFGRQMTDEQLLEKLRSLGVDLDRTSFGDLRRGVLSAADMAEQLVRKYDLRFKGFEEDWLWVCLAVLWERWYPEAPSLEMIDDAMQEGYERAEKQSAAEAGDLWLGVWKNILAVMDAQGMKLLDDFDERFSGTQSVGNWVQDVEMELHNAGIDNPSYCSEKIRFCEEVIQRTPEQDELTIENMRRSIGDAYAQMGDMRKADELFQERLTVDPQWGWGWIGWSDCYGFWKRKHYNPGRAEEILKQGLAVSGVRDKSDMLERLMTVYEDMGRQDYVVRVQEELASVDDDPRGGEIRETTEVSAHDNVLSVRTKVRFGGMGMPLDDLGRSRTTAPQEPQKKVGRNEPCPCGSGKKFKKCCGS